jgi:hypothetical protein
MMEMGLAAAIVFILVVAYYLVSKLPPATE